MSLINFTINGRNSWSDLGWVIRSTNHENIVSKRYESIPIPGRQGNLLIPDTGKDNQVIEIEAVTKIGNTSPIIYRNSIEKWLQGVVGYTHLAFSDGFQFEAVQIGDIEIIRGKCNTRTIKVRFEAIPIDPSSSKYVLSDTTDKVLLTDDTKGIEVII